jgi:hypothetical protein
VEPSEAAEPDFVRSAWVGLAAGILLVVVAVLQLIAVRRTAP